MIGDRTMRDKNSINKIFLLEALIFAGWCIAIAVTVKPDLIGFNFWCALAFSIVAFILSFVSVAGMRISSNRNLTEINALPLIASIAYLVAAVAFNSIFIFGIYFGFRAVLVVVNVLVLIAFASYRLFTNNYASHIEALSEQITAKTSDAAFISSKIAGIAGKISDEDMRKRVLKLKETVDYSTNITQAWAVGIQDEFLLELNILETMLDEGCSKAAFDEKMSKLEAVWKSRNSAMRN